MDFKSYFSFHILKRFKIALSYRFNRFYIRKYGILDCFDFQEKDLIPIKKFLYYLTKDKNCENLKTIVYLQNKECQLRFTIWKLAEDLPYWLGWEIQFVSLKIFGRIKYALKYLFGKVNDEQEFEINKKDAARLKGLITVVRKINEESVMQ